MAPHVSALDRNTQANARASFRLLIGEGYWRSSVIMISIIEVSERGGGGVQAAPESCSSPERIS